MPVQCLIINGTNVDTNNSNNNRYIYKFPTSANFKNAKIAINSISLYYSWFNISAKITNNTFSYTWYSGAGPTSTTISITVPDGFYTISDLNSYLQSVMISNNHYLIDSSGNYVYFLEFTTNQTYYAVQINSYYLLTSAQASALSYTAPSGWAGYVTTNITPQIVIPSSNSIKDIVGFTAGTYPSATQTTNYSVTSSYTPQVTPVQSLVLTCSLVNNRLSLPNNVLYSFAPTNTSFGSTIASSPSNYNFVDICDGNYSELVITILDQSFKPIIIKDTNLIIQLTILLPE